MLQDVSRTIFEKKDAGATEIEAPESKITDFGLFGPTTGIFTVVDPNGPSKKYIVFLLTAEILPKADSQLLLFCFRLGNGQTASGCLY